jgi:hypothetical protein
MSGIASRVASATICWRRLVKNGSPPTRSCAGAPLPQGGEGGVDLAQGAGIEDKQLPAERARGLLCVAYRERGFRKLRVHQQGDESSIWNKFAQQPPEAEL